MLEAIATQLLGPLLAVGQLAIARRTIPGCLRGDICRRLGVEDAIDFCQSPELRT